MQQAVGERDRPQVGHTRPGGELPEPPRGRAEPGEHQRRARHQVGVHHGQAEAVVERERGDPDVLRPEAQRGRDRPGVGRQVRVRQPDGLGAAQRARGGDQRGQLGVDRAPGGLRPAQQPRPAQLPGGAVPRRDRFVTLVERELRPVGGEQGVPGGEVRPLLHQDGVAEAERPQVDQQTGRAAPGQDRDQRLVRPGQASPDRRQAGGDGRDGHGLDAVQQHGHRREPERVHLTPPAGRPRAVRPAAGRCRGRYRR